MLETGHTIGIKVTKYYHFHNDFLNWLAIGGLFGIAGWLSTVGLLAKQAFKDPARLFFLVSAHDVVFLCNNLDSFIYFCTGRFRRKICFRLCYYGLIT